jgi:HD superfamily phosphohydrolase
MTSALRGGRIADPVHGYVDFTWIERMILDQPVAQRLRYIRQNGLGHLVFPEANSSRFAHSLGAMHLASRFLRALFANSDPMVRDRFVASLGQSVDETAGSVSNFVASLESLPPEAMACIRAHLYCSNQIPQMRIAEQGLRLAALFHDLGHLPFSHDFEEGLEIYWDSISIADRAKSPFAPLFRESRRLKEKLHERIGHGLALLLFKHAFGELQTQNAAAHETVRVSFQFAYRILADAPRRPSDEQESVLALLHALVDGEVDVDRCDYILRDGRNYGFEFARFDLDRLVDNLRLCAPEDQYRLAVRAHGLTALETYLLARYRSYENAVRHHKVAQVGAALRQAIAETLRRFKTNRPIETFTKDVGTVGGLQQDNLSAEERSELLQRFSQYDDGWCMGWLRKLDSDGTDPWAAVACRRAYAKSLWKRPDQFRNAVGGNPATWNRGLPRRDDDTQVTAWNQEYRRLVREGALVVRHLFEPWKREPERTGDSVVLVETSTGQYEPVNRASSIVDSLWSALDDAVQVHAFVSEGSPITAGDVVRRLPRFEQEEDA